MKKILKVILIIIVAIMLLYLAGNSLKKADDRKFNEMLKNASDEQKEEMLDMLMEDEKCYDDAKTRIQEDLLLNDDASEYYNADDVCGLIYGILPQDEADAYVDTLIPYNNYDMIDHYFNYGQ